MSSHYLKTLSVWPQPPTKPNNNCRLREAEKRNEDIYEKLPLFEIEDKYNGTEAGKILVRM